MDKLKKHTFSIISSVGVTFVIAVVLYIHEIQADVFIYIKAFILIFIIIYTLLSYLVNNNCFQEESHSDTDRQTEINLLKANEKYRKEFLGNVSHELKTPIFNIQGYVYTLLEGGIDDKDINIRYLKKAKKNIKRLITIVEDLLTISKLETRELKLNLESFDIVKLIKEIFDLFETEKDKNNISLKLKTETEKLFVLADREFITEVLTNLISNSMLYGVAGGNTEVSAEEKGDKILISVTDNGIGIKEEHLKRIFERFFRVDKSRSKELGGTGLGLSIVKHIIDGHNESINVSSEIGRGTTFSFTLQKNSIHSKK